MTIEDHNRFQSPPETGEMEILCKETESLKIRLSEMTSTIEGLRQQLDIGIKYFETSNAKRNRLEDKLEKLPSQIATATSIKKAPMTAPPIITTATAQELDSSKTRKEQKIVTEASSDSDDTNNGNSGDKSSNSEDRDGHPSEEEIKKRKKEQHEAHRRKH